MNYVAKMLRDSKKAELKVKADEWKQRQKEIDRIIKQAQELSNEDEHSAVSKNQ